MNTITLNTYECFIIQNSLLNYMIKNYNYMLLNYMLNYIIKHEHHTNMSIKHTSPLFIGFPISHFSKVLLWGTHSTGSPLCKKKISF